MYWHTYILQKKIISIFSFIIYETESNIDKPISNGNKWYLYQFFINAFL